MQYFLSLWLNAGAQITHGDQVQRPRHFSYEQLAFISYTKCLIIEVSDQKFLIQVFGLKLSLSGWKFGLKKPISFVSKISAKPVNLNLLKKSTSMPRIQNTWGLIYERSDFCQVVYLKCSANNAGDPLLLAAFLSVRAHRGMWTLWLAGAGPISSLPAVYTLMYACLASI